MELYAVVHETMKPPFDVDIVMVTEDKQQAADALETRREQGLNRGVEEVFLHVWEDGERQYCTRNPEVL